MKAYVFCAVSCLCHGIFLSFLFLSVRGPGVSALCTDQPCGDPPCCNGDVNGDGSIDIGDAVFVLQYLFARGPEPEVIACSKAGALPETGQTKCYDKGGNEIPCDRADFPGQDGLYQAGCPMEGRFVDNGDGTVTDNCTGLMWQKATADTNGDGQITDADNIDWQQALQYCENLILCRDGTWTTDPDVAAEHGGVKYDDWRLPNLRELQSIVDYGHGRIGPAIDPVFDCASWWYWSSSTFVIDSGGAWDVYFYHGDVDDADKWDQLYVRAVRRGL